MLLSNRILNWIDHPTWNAINSFYTLFINVLLHFYHITFILDRKAAFQVNFGRGIDPIGLESSLKRTMPFVSLNERVDRLNQNSPRLGENRSTREKTKEEAEKTGVARCHGGRRKREGERGGGGGRGEKARELHRDYRMQYDSHLDSAPHGICMTC